MLARTLAYFGHTVIQARNGMEGLDLFAMAVPDLVITDIVMPEKEGIEVILAVRNKRPTVKIIAMSGGGRQSPADYLQMAKMLGASTALTKPFSTEVLMAAVDELLATGASPIQT